MSQGLGRGKGVTTRGAPRSSLGGEDLCKAGSSDSRALRTPRQKKDAGGGTKWVLGVLVGGWSTAVKGRWGGWAEFWGAVETRELGTMVDLRAQVEVSLRSRAGMQKVSGQVTMACECCTTLGEVRIGVGVRCGCGLGFVGKLGWVKLG